MTKNYASPQAIGTELQTVAECQFATDGDRELTLVESHCQLPTIVSYSAHSVSVILHYD